MPCRVASGFDSMILGEDTDFWANEASISNLRIYWSHGKKFINIFSKNF